MFNNIDFFKDVPSQTHDDVDLKKIKWKVGKDGNLKLSNETNRNNQQIQKVLKKINSFLPTLTADKIDNLRKIIVYKKSIYDEKHKGLMGKLIKLFSKILFGDVDKLYNNAINKINSLSATRDANEVNHNSQSIVRRQTTNPDQQTLLSKPHEVLNSGSQDGVSIGKIFKSQTNEPNPTTLSATRDANEVNHNSQSIVRRQTTNPDQQTLLSKPHEVLNSGSQDGVSIGKIFKSQTNEPNPKTLSATRDANEVNHNSQSIVRRQTTNPDQQTLLSKPHEVLNSGSQDGVSIGKIFKSETNEPNPKTLLKKAIKDSENFQRIFNNLLDSGRRIEAIELAHIIYKKQICSSENYMFSEYALVLGLFFTIFPSINDYFHPGLGFGVYRMALQPKAIEILVDYLKDKKKDKPFHNLEISICPNMKDFSQKLSETILRMDTISGPQRAGFIVRHFGVNRTRDCVHTTPIYIEKTENNKYRILVTDSTSTFWFNVQVEIDELLSSSKFLHRPAEFELYCYNGSDRQMDKSNCSIYSIRDLVQLSSHSKEIFDWLDKDTNHNYGVIKECIKLPWKMFDEIPSRLMKLTQSISKIDKFQKKYNVVILSPKHRVKLEDKEYNYKVRNLFLKYERIIFAEIFENLKLQIN